MYRLASKWGSSLSKQTRQCSLPVLYGILSNEICCAEDQHGGQWVQGYKLGVVIHHIEHHNAVNIVSLLLSLPLSSLSLPPSNSRTQLPELIHTDEKGCKRLIVILMTNIGFWVSFIILVLIAVYEDVFDHLIDIE